MIKSRKVPAFFAALLIGNYAFGAASSTGAKAQAAKPQMSYGTAFAVSEDGDLVTNAHVVAGCSSVDALLGPNELPGEVTVRDPTNDLAIIRLRQKSPHFAVLRRMPEVRSGDYAITFGFPFPGKLTREGNLTIGYVSALRGLFDNPNYIQISTPTQPGSSGGALLDMSGHVIGVVGKTLKPDNSVEAGEFPQLANFAITIEMLRHFLKANKIPLTERDSTQELKAADVGDQARLFSYSIRCVPNDAEMVTAVPTEIPDEAKPDAGASYERAVLFEEDPGNPSGRDLDGSVTWRIQKMPPGSSSEIVLVGDIRIPNRIHALLSVERDKLAGGSKNLRFEVSFEKIDSSHGGVVSVPGILMKLSERAQGIAVVLRTSRARSDSFVLSGDEGSNLQNLSILSERAWLDLPMVYKDRHRAILTLAKGVSGRRDFDEVLNDKND